ncbi:uncharacterized protein LOC129912226 isoform X2 [Episyrphus balteatus]|uniref:uncharacterized protein LOC129912226 isoform X2 n=1 Tax=Episyrphus balteatus TaxID=286459 RepID=UPI0024850EC4|nr:uncharacterized protein LOC129912226 isoform X2 [Episyrphus balteatus]
MLMASRYSRCYCRLRRHVPKKSINIIHVGKSQFNEAVAFMKNNFLDDPFLRAMGISIRHSETQHFLSKLWLTLLRSGLSFSAVYRQKICGLCINCPRIQRGSHFSHDNDTLLELAKLTQAKSTRNLLLAWDKIDRGVIFPISKNNEVDNGREIKILELAGCTVDHYYRRLGIARKMIQSSADMAMLMGFDYIRIDCTHEATAKICNQLGWQKIWEMPFQMFDGVAESNSLATENKSSTVRVFVKRVNSKL